MIERLLTAKDIKEVKNKISETIHVKRFIMNEINQQNLDVNK